MAMEKPQSEDAEVKELPWHSQGFNLVNYEGFWLSNKITDSIIAMQRHFQAQPTDIIIASNPKTGSTWLKSLLFSIVDRHRHPISASPLLRHHPHELIIHLETVIYRQDQNPDLSRHCYEDSHRIFSTHISYGSLPKSMKDSRSGCKIVYIARNPMDRLVSGWHFTKDLVESKKYKEMCSTEVVAPPFEEYFEWFCQGVVLFGPFFEHVLGYWEQSLQNPTKVLFLKYEELKENPVVELKRIGDFVGCPFTSEEEQAGAIEDILKLCDIKNMKEREANMNGIIYPFIEKKAYFRKGEVGDWVNYLTPSMTQRLRELTAEKLHGTGLTFKEV